MNHSVIYLCEIILGMDPYVHKDCTAFAPMHCCIHPLDIHTRGVPKNHAICSDRTLKNTQSDDFFVHVHFRYSAIELRNMNANKVF